MLDLNTSMWYNDVRGLGILFQAQGSFEERFMNENQPTTRSKPSAESAMTYQQHAYEFVKARIMNLDVKPGEYITDSQVARELEISRTPVREALRRLEQEGLLISQARRGWKVYTLSLKDIHEIFDIKVALEQVIVQEAARCEDGTLRSALREALERMQRAAEAHDPEAWLEADIQLHQVVFAMSSNERAISVLQNLDDQWYRVRVGLVALRRRIGPSTAEHRALVESILAGNGKEVANLMRNHVNNVRQELVHVLVNLVLPFVESV